MADIKLEYVSSGNSAIKIPRRDKNNETHANIEKALRSLSDDHDCYSMLYNAFTEEKLGELIHEWRDTLENIHSDSGGLQILTLGRTAEDDDKRKVYSVQSDYSNVAMCFDRIPVTSNGLQVRAGSTSGKFYVPEQLEECAKETAKNLNTQIDYFLGKKSDTKPMLILQGNDFDSYQKWIDVCCDELGDKVKHIHGLAVAGSTLGMGVLEDVIKSSVILCDYPSDLNTKNIHLLGVGSAARFFPYVFMKKQYEGRQLSYDSTSITKLMFTGKYTDGKRIWNVSQMGYSKVLKICEDIFKDFGEEVTPEEVLTLYQGSLLYKEKTGKLGAHCDRFILVSILVFSQMVKNVQRTLRGHFSDPKTLPDRNKDFRVVKMLEYIDSKDDYKTWEREYGKYLYSDRVETLKKMNSLEDLFV